MLTGFYMIKGGGQKFSPSFPRGGLAALFSLEILGLIGSPSSMTVLVEHKNIEDTSWTTAATFASITSSGTKTIDASSLKEQLRFSLAVTATNDWEGFYMLFAAPAWRPY